MGLPVLRSTSILTVYLLFKVKLREMRNSQSQHPIFDCQNDLTFAHLFCIIYIIWFIKIEQKPSLIYKEYAIIG